MMYFCIFNYGLLSSLLGESHFPSPSLHTTYSGSRQAPRWVMQVCSRGLTSHRCLWQGPRQPSGLPFPRKIQLWGSGKNGNLWRLQLAMFFTLFLGQSAYLATLRCFFHLSIEFFIWIIHNIQFWHFLNDTFSYLKLLLSFDLIFVLVFFLAVKCTTFSNSVFPLSISNDHKRPSFPLSWKAAYVHSCPRIK